MTAARRGMDAAHLALLWCTSRDCRSVLDRLIASDWSVLHTQQHRDIAPLLGQYPVDLLLLAGPLAPAVKARLLETVWTLAADLPVAALGSADTPLLEAFTGPASSPTPAESLLAAEPLTPTLTLWSPPRTRQRAAVQRVLAFVAENYAHPLTLEVAARVACYSPSHLSRAFHRETGHTFVAHLTEVRVAQARRLLAGTPLSVTEVARAVGFKDLSHFQRVFRRSTGTSPSTYRRGAQDSPGIAQDPPHPLPGADQA